jgi:tetratricopeptide (TPR) repeat protein
VPRVQALRVVLAAIAACSSCCRDEQYGAGRSGAGAQAESATAHPRGFVDDTRSAEAREAFRRGLVALHWFWYEQAADEFARAVAADRHYTMAHWGVAMSKMKLLWGEDDFAGARAALKAVGPTSRLAPRERAWVRAATALVDGGQQSRSAFAAAMTQVHAEFPDDDSAAFLALALLATVGPASPDKEAVRERAADLAEEVFRRNPKHPGGAHYLMHAADSPGTAERALEAARVAAATAPEAFHARHMPAHIFGRLAMWKEAVASCRSAWHASVAWARHKHLSADHHDFHSLSWIIEISFERGRRDQADAAMKVYADAVRAGLDHQRRSGYANQVASYMARTGEWQRADELLAALDAVPADQAAGSTSGGAGAMASCHADAPAARPYALLERRLVIMARLRAAAMRRRLPETRRLLAERKAADEELRPYFEATLGPAGYAARTKVSEMSDAAMLARARRDDRALVPALRALAEQSAYEFDDEGTAGGNLPTEELAETLVRLGRTEEALALYERIIREHPGRASALLGAARGAKRSGQDAAARRWYQRLVGVWSEAQTTTPGLDEARAGVGAAGGR